LLILDEPTNHLDIDSRRALLDALNDYEGAVILITHDRSLIELVADRLWLTAGGHIKAFAGDMDDYARFVLERARTGARAPSQPGSVKVPATGDQTAAQAARDAARKAARKRRRRGS
jgi:ATP-binding cassette subfamily F protein 3